MKISTKGRYALEALVYMAHAVKNEPINIRQVGESTNISDKYLEQLFFLMRKKGIIDTIRGPKGGYYIAKPCEEITAGDIIRSVEGDISPVPCIKSPELCASNQQDVCVTRTVWQQVSDTIDSVLDNTTLQYLVEQYEALLKENKKHIEYYI